MTDQPITESFVIWMRDDDDVAAYLCEKHPKILDSGWVVCWAFGWLAPSGRGWNEREYFDTDHQQIFLPAWRVKEITCPD